MTSLIAIAGGIGSGKSVVSRILRAMGCKVYDCDSEARRLMDNDEVIKCRLAEMIAPEVILHDRSIDRRRLAEIVFADRRKLETLNSI
ncbi:MAG: dephospho-CoA kinase, partial [Muribaculum sp.]|nr:dephospho-CoA kinase [Muribaculum sp.]